MSQRPEVFANVCLTQRNASLKDLAEIGIDQSLV